MVVVTVEHTEVSIHTFGAICDGKLMPGVFLICSKHLLEMLVEFLAYKAVIHDGGMSSS